MLLAYIIFSNSDNVAYTFLKWDQEIDTVKEDKVYKAIS